MFTRKNFLASLDDPNYWRTVKDEDGNDYILSNQEIEILRRIATGKLHDASYDHVDWEGQLWEPELFPIKNRPTPKRHFKPSVRESKIIVKMIKKMRSGEMPLPSEVEAQKKKNKLQKKPDSHDVQPDQTPWSLLWDESGDALDEIAKYSKSYIAPNKMKLPGNEESYHPPKEYLFDDEEKTEWDGLHPQDKKGRFEPKDFEKLRYLPDYDLTIQERYQRCKDLFLAPRFKRNKKRLTVQDLLPELPDPSNLRPFPLRTRLIFKGHTDVVNSVSVNPSGHFIASGSLDGSVRIWDLWSGRCVKIWRFSHAADTGRRVPTPVLSVTWNPNPFLHCLAVAVGSTLVFLCDYERCTPQQLSTTIQWFDKAYSANVDAVVAVNIDSNSNSKEPNSQHTDLTVKHQAKSKSSDDTAVDTFWNPDPNHKNKKMVTSWVYSTNSELDQGFLGRIHHLNPIKTIVWHKQGDYCATLCKETKQRTVLIHHISKGTSLSFGKAVKGDVQTISFDPMQPHFFICTKKHIYIFDLLTQNRLYLCRSNVHQITSIDVHPSGDHFLLGAKDRRVLWFDVAYNTDAAFKNMQFHKAAVRAVSYHKSPTYPLFASAGDDSRIYIYHGKVSNDLSSLAKVIPLKILRGHARFENMGVTDICWHPYLPYLFSSGADTTIRMWVT